jgi:hypothetical protein
MAVRISAAVQWLQGSMANRESRSSTIGPITLEVKQTGERSALCGATTKCGARFGLGLPCSLGIETNAT